VWIERSLSDHIRELAQHFPALLLTGARQTGKTALLRHLFPDASFVSLDLPSAAQQAEEAPQDFLGHQVEPLIVDEVQYAPKIFRYLKAAIDEKRHRMGRFLMTGSQKFSLMQSITESLSGRCAVVELDTLSSTEIHQAPLTKPLSLSHFLWRGGFPELYRNPALRAYDFYSSYVATYLERDVRLSLRVGSLRDFERFLRACALRSGQLVNLTDLARDIGIAGTTARDWLSVLETSNQVILLEPYFGNVTKRLIKTPKLYLRDTGILCFLLGVDSPEAVERSPFIGAIWETYVLNQLLRAKAAKGSAARIFFWRDAHGTEVDFAIEHQGFVRLLEAKWAETLADSRAVAPLLKVAEVLGPRAAKEHWIVCRTPHSYRLPTQNTVKLVNGYTVEDWLPTETQSESVKRKKVVSSQ
jgi:predicted AAA+ superfamily ATPase